MKRILLLCDAGMSTSLMVKKMKEAAVKKGIETEINALSIAKFQENLNNYDVFLLGPQVKYKKAELAAVAETVGKKVEIINTMDYGMMKGDKVLELALSLID